MHKQADSLQGFCLASAPGHWGKMSPQPYQDNSHSVHPGLTSHTLTASMTRTFTAPGETSTNHTLHWPLRHCPYILLLSTHQSSLSPSPLSHSLFFCCIFSFSYTLYLSTNLVFNPFLQISRQSGKPTKKNWHTPFSWMKVPSVIRAQNPMMIST